MTLWKIHYQPALSHEHREYIERTLYWDMRVRFVTHPTPHVLLWNAYEHWVDPIVDYMTSKGYDIIAVQREEGVP